MNGDRNNAEMGGGPSNVLFAGLLMRALVESCVWHWFTFFFTDVETTSHE